MKVAPRTQPTPTNRKFADRTTQQTLIHHLHELRARLFWIVLALLLTSSAGYFIQDQIMAALMSPLGGQRLVYLTPIGGFNFIFKVSLYFGIGLILPVIVYHLYRFLEPLMDVRRKRSVIFYSIASVILALGGASFAYFASLPAALHFLTGFNIQNVSAMLTVDSYLSFVITYVLGFAALFQIPLILMIVNTIKPLPPKKLLGFERYVVLAAFVLGAIISPTPDVTNQAILAAPIILMYQVGLFFVWIQSRAIRRRTKKQPQSNTPPTAVISTLAPVVAPPSPSVFVDTPPVIKAPTTTVAPVSPVQLSGRQPRRIMDIAGPPRLDRPLQPVRPVGPASRQQVLAVRPAPAVLRPVRRASIDGIISPSRQVTAAN